MTLTDEQLEALIKASEPDQVSDILAQYTPKEFLAIPLQKRYSFVLNMIERASSIGISAPMDYAMYCGMMLLKGAEFDKSPGWATLREQILRGEITLAEAIEYVESEEA